jgi:hypothetical protein
MVVRKYFKELNRFFTMVTHTPCWLWLTRPEYRRHHQHDVVQMYVFLARDNLKKWVDDVPETRPEGLILRKETRCDTQKIDLKIGSPHHYEKEWPSMSSILDLTLGVTALAGMSDGVRNDLVAVVTCIAKASVGVAVEIIHHYQQGRTMFLRLEVCFCIMPNV